MFLRGVRGYMRLGEFLCVRVCACEGDRKMNCVCVALSIISDMS